MYAVIRSYSGTGASDLADLIAGRQAEVEGLLRSISGFVSWTLIRTENGSATITVCQNKEGTDESMQLAREWIQENASELNVDPPSVSEGPAPLHVTSSGCADGVEASFWIEIARPRAGLFLCSHSSSISQKKHRYQQLQSSLVQSFHQKCVVFG